MITSLGGGVGAGKFLKGLALAADGEKPSVIVNTADDIRLWGLNISPDIDTVIYWLCGLVDKKKGWGIRGDSFNFIGSLRALGEEAWFNIGDGDLAVHILRTRMLAEGKTLSGATREISRRLGADSKAAVFPMTDARVETWIDTGGGEMHFQEYYIRRRMKPRPLGVRFRGIETAAPAPGVAEAIRDAEKIIICPSNPVISVGPVLGVPGVREAVRKSRAPVAAISPIVGGRALKGPADRLMRAQGHEVSPLGVARMYADFLSLMVIDRTDASYAPLIENEGIAALVADTVISDARAAEALARRTLEKLDSLR
ncbi:MAG: 2-phospho-L-lactate transferase [Candidatus Dadabacteria bacterium]|nr:2-phospho-L-lactate transferase [Candidatus Dadabacteria bacterium]